ncbi:MAG: hypothetical protein JWR51_3439 [Devosia sp.]|uniref:hypothetical protein n=1 Tax=Devosia sp. TaxID=1871048 RepID=UPI00261318D0|nr:hypothetical protein [Devosia sp.]MDB5530336.1 hypothetical protein [Devosia sp.]
MSDIGPLHRFVPDVDRLTGFFDRYEDERRRAGIGTALVRISPQQRIDAVVTILGLNASGWRRLPDEKAEDLWLRFLRPVLAETGESALALEAAVDRSGLPGVFDPAVAGKERPELEEDPPPKIPTMPLWRLLLHLLVETGQKLLTDLRVLAVGAAMIAVGVAAIVFGPKVVDTDRCVAPPCIVASRVVAVPDVIEQVPLIADPFGDNYRIALDIVLRAVQQDGGAITPHRLAEYMAGESDRYTDPAIFLTVMMAAWPQRIDEIIPDTTDGAYILSRYAAAFAALDHGTPTETRRPALNRDTGSDTVRRTRLAHYAASGIDGPNVVEGSTASFILDDWLRWITFLPVLPALIWAWLTALPAFKAQLTNTAFGARGSRRQLAAADLAVTAPPPARKLVRKIAWREPGIARRIDAERSVRRTIARGGFLSIVMRRKPRTSEFVFLVPRLRVNDHERDRVSRFIDALERGGLSLSVYDYDPDPRTLRPRATGPGGTSGETQVLDLRALREAQPEARLVLITGGAELVDYFSQRPLPFVAELAAWPACMLLTPTPVGEWGEREMNLADALGAVVGRATAEAFTDLAVAFGERPHLPPKPDRRGDDDRRESSGEGAANAGTFQRLAGWLDDAERLLDIRHRAARRPRRIRLDDPAIRSDAAPTQLEQQALVNEIQAWLGSVGFLWLAACAAYPELRFAITLYLGLNIKTRPYPDASERPLYSERMLAQLSLLPWFRVGRMPPWLRRALFSRLSAAERARIRTVVDAMLNAGVAPETASGSAETTLNIWTPDNRGLQAPIDAVMADLLFRETSDIAPVLQGGAFSALFRGAALRVWWTHSIVVGAVALWCLAAYLLWPASTIPPQPAGIWLPIGAFFITSMAITAIAGAVWFVRFILRVRDDRLEALA